MSSSLLILKKGITSEGIECIMGSTETRKIEHHLARPRRDGESSMHQAIEKILLSTLPPHRRLISDHPTDPVKIAEVYQHSVTSKLHASYNSLALASHAFP